MKKGFPEYCQQKVMGINKVQSLLLALLNFTNIAHQHPLWV